MGRELEIDALLAKQEIYEAMMRYCRGVDRADGALMRSAYHEDAWDHHGFGGSAKGWAMAKAYGDSEPVWRNSQHFIGNFLVTVDGDRAGSEAYFYGTHRFEHDGTEYDFISAGRYLDRWERRDGAFKIVERNVVWDYVRTDPVTGTWPGPDPSVPKAHWAGAPLSTEAARFGVYSSDDPSYQVLALQD